ncbi:hypothetical protein GCM10009836_40790 [Pseudonocardia ailaonensis]|uniref:DUF4350 domain-containing protein n=1 Tax=Pseudonocardia ailaonensis TaxID=367279 RepID=A0ABN2NA33_9PSEU
MSGPERPDQWPPPGVQAWPTPGNGAGQQGSGQQGSEQQGSGQVGAAPQYSGQQYSGQQYPGQQAPAGQQYPQAGSGAGQYPGQYPGHPSDPQYAPYPGAGPQGHPAYPQAGSSPQNGQPQWAGQYSPQYAQPWAGRPAATATKPPRERGTPALGRTERLRARSIAVRLGVLVLLLAIGLAVRATGVLHPAPPPDALPPLEAVARVLPDVIRADTPLEPQYGQLRDQFGVKGIVMIGIPGVEEQAVTQALGLDFVAVRVPDGEAPTAEQLTQISDFVKSAGGTVLLHDDTGTGPVVVTGALLQLLRGQPLAQVRAGLSPTDTRGLSPAQTQALTDAAAALSGAAAPGNPYATLRK